MTTIKAKSLDESKIGFHAPMHILGGNYTIPVVYEESKLQLQLPRCTVLRAVYAVDGKHYMDILVKQNSVTACMVQKLQRSAQHHLLTLADYNMHNCEVHSHMSIVSRDAEGVYYALRLKLPRIGQRYQVRVTNSAGILSPITHLENGASILVVAVMESIYCINGIGGFYLNVKEIKICE